MMHKNVNSKRYCQQHKDDACLDRKINKVNFYKREAIKHLHKELTTRESGE